MLGLESLASCRKGFSVSAHWSLVPLMHMGRRMRRPYGLDDTFRQLFDKQRHAVRLGHDLLYHFGWQSLSPSHSLHHGLDLRASQAAEGALTEVRARSPGWGELRAEGQ